MERAAEGDQKQRQPLLESESSQQLPLEESGDGSTEQSKSDELAKHCQQDSRNHQHAVNIEVSLCEEDE